MSTLVSRSIAFGFFIPEDSLINCLIGFLACSLRISSSLIKFLIGFSACFLFFSFLIFLSLMISRVSSAAKSLSSATTLYSGLVAVITLLVSRLASSSRAFITSLGRGVFLSPPLSRIVSPGNSEKMIFLV